MLRFIYVLSWVVLLTLTSALPDRIDGKASRELFSSLGNIEKFEVPAVPREKDEVHSTSQKLRMRLTEYSSIENLEPSNSSKSTSAITDLINKRKLSEELKAHTNQLNQSELSEDIVVELNSMLTLPDGLQVQNVSQNKDIEMEMKEKITTSQSRPPQLSKIDFRQQKKSPPKIELSELNNINSTEQTQNNQEVDKKLKSPTKNKTLRQTPSGKKAAKVQSKENRGGKTEVSHNKIQSIGKTQMIMVTANESSTNSTNNSTKYVMGTQWPLHSWYSVLTFAVLGFFMLLLAKLANYISSILNEDLLKTLDSIFRDIIIIAIIVIVAGALNYFDAIVFFEYYANFEAVNLGLLIFGLLWILLALFLIIMAQTYIKEWKDYESEYDKRDIIFRQYEDLYYNTQRTKELNTEFKHHRRQLEFFLMRQEFITPSFLPVFGEDFLRDDFNFSAYLGKCVSKVNQQAFRFDFLTFLTIAITTGFAALAHWYIKHLLIKLLIVFPILLLIPLRILARKMKRIYRQLVTIVESPYDFSLAKFENTRLPLINIEKLSMPTYLSQRRALSQFRDTWYTAATANRHLLLYWLRSPGFSIRILHSILVMHLEWIAYFILALSFGVEKFDSPFYWIGVGVAVLVSMHNLFFILPQILRLAAITNNIQMLKDRKLVQEVTEQKMHQRQRTMQNIYSVLKSIRRQSIAVGRDTHLRLYIVDHVREIFQELRGPKNDKAITYTRLVSLAHLCGRDLNEREAIILAHDVTCKNSGNITFDEFMDALEKISADVSANPVEVSKTVLKNLTSTVSSTVSLKNLKTSLEKLDLFDENDINSLLEEVKYLPLEHAQYSLNIIATLIRDSIEGMPR